MGYEPYVVDPPRSSVSGSWAGVFGIPALCWFHRSERQLVDGSLYLSLCFRSTSTYGANGQRSWRTTRTLLETLWKVEVTGRHPWGGLSTSRHTIFSADFGFDSYPIWWPGGPFFCHRSPPPEFRRAPLKISASRGLPGGHSLNKPLVIGMAVT
jgi:hypothetical protein